MATRTSEKKSSPTKKPAAPAPAGDDVPRTTPPPPDALVAKVLVAPDTAASYAAYAEHFTKHGDPLGELITLSIAGDAEPKKDRSFKVRAKKALDEYVQRILPGLLGIEPERLVWRFGLIDSFDTFMWKDKKTLAPAIAALVAHPAARFMRHLHLRDMDVPDLTAIGKLGNLRDLYLWSCKKVGSLAPLAKLSHLERFDVKKSGIHDISALAGCSRLWFVNVEHTDVATLKPLQKIPALWEVWCQDTSVSEDDASALRSAMARHPLPKRPNGGMDRRDVYGP